MNIPLTMTKLAALISLGTLAAAKGATRKGSNPNADTSKQADKPPRSSR